ncbi:MAG TPA: hypothetical protein PKN50_06305 [Spirochaetota bacterium]|nr:hypothetical protein [Spirochaetota bacterium]HPV42096.1 hypothetical protein [Spirochaetota bacterium]
MKRVMISAVLAMIFLASCMTMGGRWSQARIDSMSEKCLTENDELKPSTAKWYNLSTQARAKKKREMNEYRKRRIELYQSLDGYKKNYVHVDNDGKCRKNECKSLDRLRLLIIAGCPKTGESFPRVLPQ